MELQTDEGNFHSLKILIAASLNGKSLRTKFVGSTDRVLDYIQRNRLPILTTDRGAKIFSPNAAASLLFAETGKLGDATKVEEWLEWESSQFLPVVHRTVLASGGKMDESLLGLLNKELQTLQGNLGNKGHLLGGNLSVADVVVWSTVFPLLHASLPLKDIVAEYPKVMKWFESLEKNAAFRDAVCALFKNDSKGAIKASITAQPVPPSIASSTRKLLGSEKTLSSAISMEAEEETMATEEEKDAAVEAWLHGKSKVAKPSITKHPILPEEGKRNVLITSALPYVNNVPHLGNIIGCVLSADVYARFCRLRNYNTLYISGTDEYGTATETKAMEEGITPQEICDKYNRLHTEIYQWFNIGFDFFGRTTTQQQTKIAQDIFWKLQENGYVLQDTVDQLQCQQCNRFLADRFVEGTCPFCAYEDARGDQCDKCGKLINAAELRNPKCKTCSNTPIIKSTSHLFLDLPKLEPQLVDFLEGEFEKGIWTSNTKVITRSWIRDGLKPRCISRDLKWGTPVPLEGYTDKVFYVWYDAPIGYMSITANYTDQWEKWWKNPSQVKLYQFMAKDNIPFHSVIFPCSLLGTKLDWTMVNNLSATEYLNYEDTKFSKSRSVGVFGSDAKDTGIPADIWRFYLLYLRPETQDSSFSWSDFVLKNNSELLNNLGNFINRALMFVNNNFGAAVPAVTLTEEDKELLAQITRELKTYINNLEKIRLRDGIRNLLSISRLGNQYIQANKPWVLVKGSEEEKLRAGSVVGLAANIACLLSVLVQPYMPEVSATIQQQLQAPPDCNVLTNEFVCFLPTGHKIGKPQPLFQKIESCRVAELKKQFAGSQEIPKTVSHKPSPKAGAGQGTMAAPEVITKLMEEISKQGSIVRELKAAKVEKSIINVEVSKLLELKQQLADASGQAPAASNKKQKGGGKKDDAVVKAAAAAPSAPAAAPSASAAASAESPEVVMMLTEQVSKQGTVVRDLKAAKADKAAVDAAVAKLLDLKRLLAVATGIDPDEAVGGKSKRKGKKK